MKTEKERRWQAQLKNAAIGSYVIFGAYEQDNNLANGNEEIEWLVLARENNRLLIISRNALDSKPYNTEDVSVTWETCTLRTWLNQDFYNTAFSSEEQEMIPTVTVKAEKNNIYGPDPGNDTQDRVFLLNDPEVELYFPDRNMRTCDQTAYLAAQMAVERMIGYGSKSMPRVGHYAGWWLRSPGEHTNNRASGIDTEGYLSECDVDREYYLTVRPAIWIQLAP